MEIDAEPRWREFESVRHGRFKKKTFRETRLVNLGSSVDLVPMKAVGNRSRRLADGGGGCLSVCRRSANEAWLHPHRTGARGPGTPDGDPGSRTGGAAAACRRGPGLPAAGLRGPGERRTPVRVPVFLHHDNRQPRAAIGGGSGSSPLCWAYSFYFRRRAVVAGATEKPNRRRTDSPFLCRLIGGPFGDGC